MWRLYRQAIAMDDGPPRQSLLEGLAAREPELAAELSGLIQARGRVADFLEQPPTLLAPLVGAVGADERAAPGAAPSAIVGRRIAGRYAVLRVVATGAMGIVYEAEQDVPRRRVALKVMRSALAGDRSDVRIRLEAEALARLNHPCIAQVYETGLFDVGEGAQPFFAMEYIEGPDILEHAAGRRLSIRERVNLLAAVADAVSHAHNRGVFHRDLKPGNILVDLAAEPPRPKVVDFGVARVTDLDITATMSGGAHEIAGTLPYMSPEQLEGRSDSITSISDVYSLGVTCYEVLSGARPIELDGGALAAAVHRLLHDVPVPLGRRAAELGGDLQTIVEKAMARDPARRYASAKELANDLRRFLAHEPIIAQPPSRVYQIRKFAQRNRTLVVGAAATALAIVLGAGLSLWQAVRATRAQNVATERFNEVRGLAKTVIYELENAIRGLPGATPAQKLIIESGLEYLDRLARGAEGDLALLDELAQGYVHLGRVQGGVNWDNLGDGPGAMQSYESALRLRRMIAAADPDQVENEYAMANIHARMLALADYMGDHDVFQEHARAAIEIALGTCRRHCTIRARCALADIAQVAARISCERDGPNAAAALTQAAADHLFPLSDLAASSEQDQYAQGSLHFCLANLRMYGGQPERALDQYDLAAPLLARLVAEFPGSINNQLAVASNFEYRAQALEALDRPGDALHSIEASLGAMEDAHQLFSSNPNFDGMEGRLRAKVGDRQVKAGNVEKGLANLQQACRKLQGWVDTDPQSEIRRQNLKECLEVYLDHLLTAAADPARPAEVRQALVQSAEEWFTEWKRYRLAAAGRVTVEDTRPGAAEHDEEFMRRVESDLQGLRATLPAS